MNRILSWSLSAALVAVLSFTAMAKDPAKLPFYVLGPDGKGNHWIPSGYMGNHAALKLDDKCETQPHVGKTCLKVTYSAANEWAGVFWQDPANDWDASQDGGFNVTGAKKFTFWARGEKGGEKVTIGFGGDKKGNFPNTAKGETKVTLTAEWKQYSIDLDGKDLALIKNGLFFSLGAQGDGVTFYLSEVGFE